MFLIRYLWSDIFVRYFYLIFVLSSNASTYLEECPSCWEHHVGEEGTEKIITINTDWKREVIYLKIHKKDQNLWQSFSADEKNVSWWSFQRRQKFSGIAILFFKLFFLLMALLFDLYQFFSSLLSRSLLFPGTPPGCCESFEMLLLLSCSEWWRPQLLWPQQTLRCCCCAAVPPRLQLNTHTPTHNIIYKESQEN